MKSGCFYLLLTAVAQSKPEGSVALLDADCKYERIGGRKVGIDGKQSFDGYGAWTLCTAGLSNEPIVYSVGIGSDLSFDIAMIRQFRATVYAFDPTMTRHQYANATVFVNASAQELERLTFFPFGLGGTDDVVPFYRMAHRHGMMSSRPGKPFESTPYLQAPIVRLQTMLHMTGVGRRRLDVLKVDVEGTEYDIFDESARTWLSSVPPTQIAIEFHENMFSNSRSKTAGGRAAVTRRLENCGYIQRWKGTDDTFLYVRTRDVPHGECAAEKSR